MHFFCCFFLFCFVFFWGGGGGVEGGGGEGGEIIKFGNVCLFWQHPQKFILNFFEGKSGKAMPRCEKTVFLGLRTTQSQISLRISAV